MYKIFFNIIIIFSILSSPANSNVLNVSIVKVTTNNFNENTQLNKFLIILEKQLIESKYFNYVDRKSINKIIKEKELILSGLATDTNEVKEILPLHEMIYVSITGLENGYTLINVKFLNIQTSKFTLDATTNMPDKNLIGSFAVKEIFRKIEAYFDKNSYEYFKAQYFKYYKSTDYKNALQYAVLALKKNPKSYYAYIMLGDVQKKLKNKDKAVKCYTKALYLVNLHLEQYPKDSQMYKHFKKHSDKITKSLKYIDELISTDDLEEYY